MPRLVRLCALTTLLAALWAQPASATRILGLPETMTTPHFQLHYDGFPGPPATPVLHQDAADLAGLLERSWTKIVTEYGYPAPLPDADSKIDVYVHDVTPFSILGAAFPEGTGNQRTGYMWIDDESVRAGDTAAHELFHLVQFGIWYPMDPWFLEGSAEWMSYRFLGFPASITTGNGDVPLSATLGAPDISLSCSGPACGLDSYEQGGYSRWHFFQYLTERHGSSTVEDIFDTGKAKNDTGLTATDLLIQTLQAKGSTLADTFTDWTVANMTGSYTAAGLKGIRPVTYSTTPTGTVTGTLATQQISVNHLAARYLTFTRGSTGSTGPCYAATLTLNVSFPTGLGARPYFFWDAEGSTPLPLAVNGSTATLSMPWDTCTWETKGYLSLPNPSTTVDAALFSVSGSIAVDKKTLATSTPPPAGTYTGPTVPSPDGEEPPSIAVYGPETLRVSKRKRVVRVVVFSSGGGTLDAQLGSLSLGTRALRTGNNDLRFTLPRSVTRSLAAASRLTFTSFATNGTRGATVTRKLVLTK